MRKAVLICVGLALTTSPVVAIQIAPECQKMKDPIGCTCALQNGGGITGGRWFSKRGGTRTATNEAFVQCMKTARGQ